MVGLKQEKHGGCHEGGGGRLHNPARIQPPPAQEELT